MSTISKRLPKISREPEAMMLYFADLPPEGSLEIADNFVVDFSPDDDITGLEILWDDAYRAGSEPELLAFGIFGSALVSLAYHYAKHAGQKPRDVVRNKAADYIAATDLPLHVTASEPAGLTIVDASGNPLLCADIRYGPRGIIQPDMAPQLSAGIDRLSQSTPHSPGAVGVAVFIDETGALRRQPPVAPGVWLDWPGARLLGGPSRAHVAIIPPHQRKYPWLPKDFLSLPPMD